MGVVDDDIVFLIDEDGYCGSISNAIFLICIVGKEGIGVDTMLIGGIERDEEEEEEEDNTLIYIEIGYVDR